MDVSNQILKRIKSKKRGWVFTPKDFYDLGGRDAIDQTLSRLTRQDVIRRVGRGVYDYPKYSKLLGKTLSPAIDDVAQAVASKSGKAIFISGAQAANLLGLSTQVPAKPIYLTNGDSCIKQIGDNKIILKHAKVPILDQLPYQTNLTIQALSYLGKYYVDDIIINQCVRKLSDKDRVALKKALPFAPAWMAFAINKINAGVDGSIS